MSFHSVKYPKKLLLVDDVALFLEMEKAFLSRKDFIIFTAGSGKEALQIHKKEAVDLILMDLYMPEMRGDEVCRTIRSDKDLKDVSIIMVTTSGNPEDIDICRLSGANEYITKPIDPKILMPKMFKLLNISERRNLRIPVNVEVYGKRETFTFYTVDLSFTGTLLETDNAFNAFNLDTSNSVYLSFNANHTKDQLKLKGEIVREAKRSPDGKYRYGLKFLKVDMEEKKIISSLLAS